MNPQTEDTKEHSSRDTVNSASGVSGASQNTLDSGGDLSSNPWDDLSDAADGTTRRRTIPCLTILYHPNLGRIGERLLMGDILDGRTVEISRTAPFFTPAASPSAQEPIADMAVSRKAFVLSMQHGDVRLDRAECRSPIEVNGHPVNEHVHLPLETLEEGAVFVLSHRVVMLLHMYERPSGDLYAEPNYTQLGIIGYSPGIQKLRQDLQNVAGYDVPVLLRGESGTGKELAAAAIHKLSLRSKNAFVSVNMGALPPSLAATELFGAHRGAYTGATQPQEGYFRKADGGTLFLDEIGDAPLEIQVALLRVLETSEVITLGAQRPYPVDTRIVAATDADLNAQMAAGTFREQLMHRLTGYEIWLPPLRKRRDDLGHLLLHFLRQETEKMNISHRLETHVEQWLPASIVAQMATHHWPGNVRELKNVVKQLLIHNSKNDTLKLSDSLRHRFENHPSHKAAPVSETTAIEQEPKDTAPVPKDTERLDSEKTRRKPGSISKQELVETYKAHRYEIAATAKALNLSRASLYKLIEANPNLRIASDLTPEEIRRVHAECDADIMKMVDRLGVSKSALRRRLRELRLFS